VRTFGGRLLAVAQRILRNEDDARDAVQTAYLAAFRSLDRFEGGSRLSTWLHRIVVNAALMKIRSRKRRPEESIEPLLPAYLDDGHHVERFSEYDIPADSMLERAETRAAVRECIGQLPDRYRAILVLRDIEEISTGEVAAMLGLTPNAVKIRLHRARQALATLLRRRFAETRAGSWSSKTREPHTNFRRTSAGYA
jgi:RNA polymerase sigma-70 factor (ECF subfamily)